MPPGSLLTLAIISWQKAPHAVTGSKMTAGHYMQADCAGSDHAEKCPIIIYLTKGCSQIWRVLISVFSSHFLINFHEPYQYLIIFSGTYLVLVQYD